MHFKFFKNLKKLLEKHNAEMFIDNSDKEVPVITVKIGDECQILGYHFDKDWEQI